MGRRSWRRRTGGRRYRSIVVIACEGDVTEPRYFRIIDDRLPNVQLRVLSSRGDSSPSGVLKRMRQQLSKEPLKKEDQAWIVIDRDSWPEEQLSACHDWARGHECHGLALSNPKFELWLLLHFEDGNGIAHAKALDKRLSRFLPSYRKGLTAADLPEGSIASAIERAKMKDIPPVLRWPETPGTTVYRLIEAVYDGQPGAAS